MEIENNGCIGHPVTNLLMQQAAHLAAEREAVAKPEAPAPAVVKKPAAKKPAAKKK